MAKTFKVDQGKLIREAAEELKKISEIKPPKWAVFVKTGAHKERPPVDKDWWYVRGAAVLRSVYKLGPVGVQKLRMKYGGKKNRGVAAEHFYKGSGNIIRKLLQQLEAADLIKKDAKGVHKGRVITGKGQSILDKAGLKIGGKPVKKAVAEKPKHEAKEKPKAEAKPKNEEKPSPKKEAKEK
ncbi:30S ribosomal protein S19e [Candidatus Woesearchaeota archaeon]|nr:30S ribosomal protein S19e [Candidatus Woesearchaeota archaeon]